MNSDFVLRCSAKPLARTELVTLAVLIRCPHTKRNHLRVMRIRDPCRSL